MAGGGLSGPAARRCASGEGLFACAACLRRGALVGRLAPQVARRLDRRRPGPPALFTLSDEELVVAVAGSRRSQTEAWLRSFDADHARADLQRAGVACVCRHCEQYPPGLRHLHDPPATLYVAGGCGRLETLTAEPMVAVVGSRRATGYGLEVARELGRGLSAAGVTVVSGLALGIDAAAHRGALRAGARVIAVLAAGVDIAYPPANAPLHRAVVERGCAVSELPPGTRPARWSFPARNRIMAALGRMTVVVEAAEESGSLITAQFADDIGRDVGAVPGRVTLRAAAGSNRLLRDGAAVVRGPGDVLDALFGVGARRVDGGPGELAPVDLDARSQRVLEAVEAGLGVDAIGASTALPAGDVRAALGRLELLGLVRRDGIGVYERAAG